MDYNGVYIVYDGIYIHITGWWYTYASEKTCSSVGMMTFPSEWKNNPFMFQTTNQIIYT